MLSDLSFFVFNDDWRKLFESLAEVHMPEEKYRETLVNSLLKNPFNLAAYDVCLKRYGDERGDPKTFVAICALSK